MRDRVLFVDDEPLVLESLSRALRGRYKLFLATSGARGLEMIEDSLTEGDPFAVIVSDMMMPTMDGVEFLSRATAASPNSITMILSGQADLERTIKVVNNANVFRFLTKPFPPAALSTALDHALRQYELVHAERELLERTLGGAVTVLTEVLSMASPAASRRTAQMRIMIASVAEQLGLTGDWRLPIAAMLSHIGCVAIPGHLLEKLENGLPLDTCERAMFDSHPIQGRRLLAHIPRFREIAEWIGQLPTTTASEEAADPTPEDPAALVVEVVAAFLLHYAEGRDTGAIIRDLNATRRYSTQLLDAVRGAVTVLQPRGVHREVAVNDLISGMIFEEDVRACTGQVLIRKGERVTPPLATRLANFASTVGVEEPLHVLDVGECGGDIEGR